MMDSTIRADWSQFRPSNQSTWCPACGQTCTPGRSFCGICAFHIDNSVLRVCRSLLLESSGSGKTDREGSGEEEIPSSHEMALASVADRFPLRFAQLIGRKVDLLRKAGAWLAHVIAFQYILTDEFPYESVSPQKVYEHPPFSQIRDMAYQAIHEVGTLPERDLQPPIEEETASSPDAKTDREESPSVTPPLDVLHELFICKEDVEGGARQILYDMIIDLERRKKLHVNRGGGTCSQCGVSIPKGATLCPNCSRDQQAMERLSISRHRGLQRPKPSAPAPPPSSSGMHIKAD